MIKENSLERESVNKVKKIVLFGDSITASYGEEAVSPILTNLIQAELKQLNLEAAIVNAGMPGDTTNDGLRRLEQEVVGENPEIVTIFFGANDTSSDRLVSLEQYAENLERMLTAIGREKVILLTPPYVDCGLMPSRDDERIQVYAEKVRKLGENEAVPVIDIYQEMVISQNVDELLQEDGLHFSKVGYELLAALIVQEIKGRLVTN